MEAPPFLFFHAVFWRALLLLVGQPFNNLLEVVSKRQVAFESKAQADEKAQHTWEYVSILKRSATQLSDARWCFETASTLSLAKAEQWKEKRSK
ncbi:MAG: hypothetical protein P8X68_04165 [Desulfobacterales bacterium]|jgi:hypothetical protein